MAGLIWTGAELLVHSPLPTHGQPLLLGLPAQLQVYLPTQLTAAEIETLVTSVIQETGAAGPQDIGKVMKALSAKAAGRADGKTLNELARAKLGKS